MNLKAVENILSTRMKSIINQVKHKELLQEIRLRVHKPIIIYYDNQEYFMDEQGLILSQYNSNCMMTTSEDIKETLEYVSKHSLYAFEEDIKNGYITIDGGHRIGITGKVVLEKEQVKTIRNISCINIRISHEVKGCANKILPYLYDQGNLCHTLIISPPKCGKTTLLRDLVRQISNGTKEYIGITVGLVDERSEIAGCYRGIPQNDIGIRTDVLDSCTKKEGMLMLIRAMAPRVIALDEIGNSSDIDAIEYAINAGCKLLCTVHGNSIREIKNKPKLQELIENKLFKRYVFLENQNSIGDIKKVYNAEHKMLCLLMDGRSE